VLIFFLAIEIVKLEKEVLLNIYKKYTEVFSKKEIVILFSKNINYKIIL
jgi:hypothetical protein